MKSGPRRLGNGGVCTEFYLGQCERADPGGPAKGQRSSALGVAVVFEFELGGSGSALRGTRGCVGVVYLLGQQPSHSLEVPGEGAYAENRAAYACSCSALYQVWCLCFVWLSGFCFVLFWFFGYFGGYSLVGIRESVCIFLFSLDRLILFALCVLFDEFQRHFWSVFCAVFGSSEMEENKGVPKFRLYLFFVFLFFLFVFVLQKLKIVSQPGNCLELMSGVSCILSFSIFRKLEDKGAVFLSIPPICLSGSLSLSLSPVVTFILSYVC